jgi:hypothetical protein
VDSRAVYKEKSREEYCEILSGSSRIRSNLCSRQILRSQDADLPNDRPPSGIHIPDQSSRLCSLDTSESEGTRQALGFPVASFFSHGQLDRELMLKIPSAHSISALAFIIAAPPLLLEPFVGFV